MFTLLILIAVIIVGVLLFKRVSTELEKKACLSPKFPMTKDMNQFAGREEIRIVIMGDTGSGDENQRGVAELLADVKARHGCDLVLLLGDNFIQHGVKDINDEQFQNKFEKIYDVDLPFYAVLGNHDLRGSWRAQVAYSNLSSRWLMPDVNYQFEAGPVFMQGINTSCTFCSLWTLFKKSTRPWRVVFGHRPFITSGRHRGMVGFERWVISKSKPDFYFSGHNHILEHLSAEGIEAIVSGGGGNPIHEIQDQEHPQRHYFLQDMGVVWLHFTPSKVDCRFFDLNRQVVHSFEKSK